MDVTLCTGSFGQTAMILKDAGIKKLSVFLGTWKAESAIDAKHPEPTSAVYTCQWLANGRYLVADQLVNDHGKETNNLSIYNYNPEKDDYTLSLVGIPGMQPFTVPVTYRGDTLFYTGEYTDNGKKVYNRTLVPAKPGIRPHTPSPRSLTDSPLQNWHRN